MDLTKEILYQKYMIENQTVSEIALEFGISKTKIKGLLRRNGYRKSELKLSNNLYDDKEWLYEQYITLNKGYTVIANELGVSYTTILTRILYFGWKVKGHNDIDKASPRLGKKHTQTALEKIKKSRIKHRVNVTCYFCSRVFERVNSSYMRSEKLFCNYQCYKEYLKENRVETEDITDSAEYKEWRKKVYMRDGYRCKMPKCHSDSRDIAAHHIYPKKRFPEKCFDLQNGITLCRKCHEKTFGKEEQFIDALVRVVQRMND
ncbi:HNH endonuclease [Robertmurraya massiliosenegalensis]|uniref:HNH endonuclease n=1 Tax=Robertmurraya massiliosenegalensis TaxID=1287657 RepID=UPI0003064E63|nr:HNH endonuclease signature motif containing protein [Robertmurraya massiliosenegalensis]